MVRKLNKYDLMAHEAARSDDHLSWFEKVYSGARSDDLEVPWGNKVANPYLKVWLDGFKPETVKVKSALKVGCGLGDDAEELNTRGFKTTAFDIAKSAIETATERFPDSAVNYQVADLFNPPTAWHQAFDVVVEIFTIQALPLHMRPQAYQKIASFLKPGGKLFVVCFGRSGVGPDGKTKPIPTPLRMPWPLTKEELDTFETAGLIETSFMESVDPDNARVRRFIVEYTRG